MNPFLSIIIPVYNAEDYLSGCLDSILAANLNGIEILLIDDGSKDGSLKLCQNYKKRFPFVQVFNQDNCGPSAARNHGLNESNGKYVLFIDADDYVEPSALHRTVELLREYDAQILVSDFQRIAANGCTLDKVYQIEETELPIIDSLYMKKFLSDGERVWNIWRYIFQRDFLIVNNLYFIEGVNCAEDVEYIVRALTLVEKPVFFHNPFYFYRAHYGNTLTGQYTAKRVRDLLQMLNLSAEHLYQQKTVISRLLTDKLVKEFLLNLSMCFEVPPLDRKTVITAFFEAKPIIKQASSKKLKIISAIVGMFGVRISARLILFMKKIKREIRAQKIRDYDRRALK